MIESSLPLVLAQDGPPTTPAEAPSTPAAPPPPITPGETTLTVPGDGLSTGTGADTLPPPQPRGLFGDPMLMLLIVGFGLMFFMMINGSRKEKKKRAAMLAALKKGDKVTTVGGIIGNVIEVRENEIVLKVDENSNTRMRFSRAAIQSVAEDKSE